jgi:flagellar protein FlaG
MIVNITSLTPRHGGSQEAPAAEPPRSKASAITPSPPVQPVPPDEEVTNASQPQPQPGTAESSLQEAVSVVEKHVANLQRALEFKVDEGTGRTVVTVSDRETGELIRQIPSEEALALAARLQEGTAGFLLVVET